MSTTTPERPSITAAPTATAVPDALPPALSPLRPARAMGQIRDTQVA